MAECVRPLMEKVRRFLNDVRPSTLILSAKSSLDVMRGVADLNDVRKPDVAVDKTSSMQVPQAKQDVSDKALQGF